MYNANDLSWPDQEERQQLQTRVKPINYILNFVDKTEIPTVAVGMNV